MGYLLERYKNFNDLMKISVSKLSGGEIKRFGLIRSFILDRQIEVYDEPTANLDAMNAELISNILFERSKKKIIITATHESMLLNRSSKIIKLS